MGIDLYGSIPFFIIERGRHYDDSIFIHYSRFDRFGSDQ